MGASLDLDLDLVGFGIVALFLATWAVAVALWRLGRIEDRWSAGGNARVPPADGAA